MLPVVGELILHLPARQGTMLGRKASPIAYALANLGALSLFSFSRPPLLFIEF